MKKLYAKLVIIFCLILVMPIQAKASIGMPIVDAEYFSGIDTVYVAHKSRYNSNLLPWPKRVDPLPPDPTFLAVQEAFAKYPQIKILSSRTSHSLDSFKPNVVTFYFETSAQPAVIEGKNIAVASLGIQVSKRSLGALPEILLLSPVTYPFIVPDKPEGLNKSLTEAARFLTDRLVPYFPCVKKQDSDKCRPGSKGSE